MLSMASFNIGGKGDRWKKRRLIRNFVDEHCPSLLFLQENPWRHDNIKKHVQGKIEEYNFVSYKHLLCESAVLYHKDEFNEVTDTASNLKEVFEESFEDEGVERNHLDFNTFKERASFAELSDILTEDRFIVISWHGQNNRESDIIKIAKVKVLLSVLWRVYSKIKLPIILGGDFNITLDKIQKKIGEFEDRFKFYNYELANRSRLGLIDFFVTTRDVLLSDVKALGDYMDYSSGGESDKVFDHDPVKAKFERLYRDREANFCRVFFKSLNRDPAWDDHIWPRSQSYEDVDEIKEKLERCLDDFDGGEGFNKAFFIENAISVLLLLVQVAKPSDSLDEQPQRLQAAKLLSTMNVNAGSLLLKESRMWLSSIQKRLAGIVSTKRPYYAEINASIPYDMFSVLKSVINHSEDEEFKEPSCCISTNNKAEVISFTSLCSLQKFLSILSGLSTSDVKKFFSRKLTSTSRYGNEVKLLVEETKGFDFSYKLSTGQLTLQFFYGEWNEDGSPRHN